MLDTNAVIGYLGGDQALVSCIDTRGADDAARLRRQYHLTTADAVIAATAIQARAPLITRDKKFTKIPELTCIVP